MKLYKKVLCLNLLKIMPTQRNTFFLKMTMNSLLLEFKFLFYKDVLQVLTNYLAFIGT